MFNKSMRKPISVIVFAGHFLKMIPVFCVFTNFCFAKSPVHTIYSPDRNIMVSCDIGKAVGRI